MHRLKEVRKGQGVTQWELANKIGYTQAFISNIEAGRSAPSLKAAYKIAEILNVKIEDIFTF